VTLPLDYQIDAAHHEAQRIEAEAGQIEARIVAAGGVPPVRRYGTPVSGEAVSRNLTTTGLLQRRDPTSRYLGLAPTTTANSRKLSRPARWQRNLWRCKLPGCAR
jgi:hypothetical protein